MPRAVDEYDVAVVGGGIAGLTTAYRLRESRVILLEAEKRVGGRVKSYQRGTYWVNLGAQFLAGEGPLWELARELGVESASLKGSKPALAVNDALLITDSPVQLALRLPLSAAGRIAMLRFGLKVRRTYKRLARNTDAGDARRFRDQLDQLSAAEYFADIRNTDAQEIMRAFVRFWMGVEPEEVSAGHTAVYLGLSIADLGELPPFSLVRGGNEQLPQAIARALGDRAQTSAVVEAVRADGSANGIRIRYRQHGEIRELTVRECVMAVPAYVALKLLAELPKRKRDALQAVRYGTYVTAGVYTEEASPTRWDQLYAATVVGKSFQVMINPATVLRRVPDRQPGGALLLYAGGAPARALLERSDAEIADTFRSDLERLLPELNGKTAEIVIQRWPRAIPYWEPGGRAHKEALRESVGHIHFAADYVAYPSMQVAAIAASTVARSIAERLPTVITR